ncbi:MAG: hypothetical protein AB4062_18735 [Crocosphaera sp.]
MFQPDVKQSVFENVKVKGNFTFDGDITQIGSQTVVQQKPDFFEPSLEKYHFKNLQITSQLLARLKHLRFLVLGGSSDVDKDSLAKHTACCLIKELESNGEEIIPKEWYRSSDPQTIEVELENTKESTVFILTQVTPQNIGYNLTKIQKAANNHNHYVVLSTEITFTAWRQPESNKKLWYEVSQKKVADCQDLINHYSQADALSNWYFKLQSRERLLALGLSFFDGLFDDQFFAALEEIVENVWQKRDASLRALDYCDLENLEGSFFNFTTTKYQGTKISIRFPKQRRTLFKIAWKSDRRQILSALPVMVNIVSESVPRSLTNSELYGSQTRCKEIRTAIAETISDIGSISLNSVQTSLLQLAANKHRVVQSTAAYAMARWRDSDYGLDQQLFETLHSWLDLVHAKRIIDQVEAILKGRNQDDNEDLKAENYIKVTVALTVGYASLYDPPEGLLDSEGLSQDLYDLLHKLSHDRNQVVRNTFLYFTLPKVLQLHLQQLSSWLHDLTRQQVSDSSSQKSIIQFNQAVGRSLALAYKNYPEETVDILDTWTEEERQNTPEYLDISKITSRESLLSTVARTYGEIEFVQGNNQLTPQDIFIRLQTMLHNEKHPFIREAILFAIGRQARLHFNAIEPQLQALVPQIKEKERQKIIDILSDIYLEQRIDLSGGDYWSKKKFTQSGYSYQYQIWIKEQRPDTFIEQAMKHWIKNASNEHAQKIGINALFSFADILDKEEKEEKNRILRNLDADPIIQRPPSIEEELKPSHNIYIKIIVAWLTLLIKWIQYFFFQRKYYQSFASKGGFSYYQPIVTVLLPEVLKKDSYSEDTKSFVVERLSVDQDKELPIIVDMLKLAIFIAKAPLLVMFIPIFIIVIISWLFLG